MDTGDIVSPDKYPTDNVAGAVRRCTDTGFSV